MFVARILGLAVVAYGAYMLISTRAKAAITDSLDAMPPVDAAVDVVARTLWGEARGEGYEGMQAVACVIANRVSRPGWWGTDWRTVCLKPYQFSCWLESDPNLVKLSVVDASDPSFAAALEIAAAAVSGRLGDITSGATYYFNPSVVRPAWAAEMTVTAEIGSHVFLVG